MSSRSKEQDPSASELRIHNLQMSRKTFWSSGESTEIHQEIKKLVGTKPKRFRPILLIKYGQTFLVVFSVEVKICTGSNVCGGIPKGSERTNERMRESE